MSLFENPFYVLGASPSDSRRRLRALYDEKILLCPSEKVDAALQELTHPLKRLDAEIRWFPGCTPEESLNLGNNLQKCSAAPTCSLKNVLNVNSPISCFSYINQLLTLLPQFSAAMMDEVMLNAAKQFDDISVQNTMEVINAARIEAGFNKVEDIAVLEAALQSYKREIVAAFDERIARLEFVEYDILIRRIAAFGTSPIIESAIRKYEISVSDKLDLAEAEVSRGVDVLERFFAKDLHADSIASIRAAVSTWFSMIEPLQIYSRTMGTESITATRENVVLNKLMGCGQELNNQRSTLYAAEVFRCSKMIITQTKRFESLNAEIDAMIASLDAENAELLKKQKDEYERLSARAWEEEQRKNDEFARQRSVDYAKKEQERILQKQKEQEDDIAILKARYEQVKKEEESKRQVERKAQEVHKLDQKKIQLQEKRKNLGIFSGKEKRRIDDEIAEIERRLLKL